jgi:hypothetical protein
MILATSEASLLSVVFPARNLRLTLERNLQAGLLEFFQLLAPVANT